MGLRALPRRHDQAWVHPDRMRRDPRCGRGRAVADDLGRAFEVREVLDVSRSPADTPGRVYRPTAIDAANGDITPLPNDGVAKPARATDRDVPGCALSPVCGADALAARVYT